MAQGGPVKTSGSPRPSHYASLSPARKRLVDVLRDLQFGRIEGLAIVGGEPQFDPPHSAPTIIRTIRLPVETESPEPNAQNFPLKQPMLDLLQHFDRQQAGIVLRLECRHGLPCLCEFLASTANDARATSAVVTQQRCS
jgi:hypothetical protein